MLKTILWRWRFRKLSPQGSEPWELVSTLTSSQATFFKLWVAAHLSVIKSVYWIEENQVGHNRKYYSIDTFVNLFLPVGCGQKAWKSAALTLKFRWRKCCPRGQTTCLWWLAIWGPGCSSLLSQCQVFGIGNDPEGRWGATPRGETRHTLSLSHVNMIQEASSNQQYYPQYRDESNDLAQKLEQTMPLWVTFWLVCLTHTYDR